MRSTWLAGVRSSTSVPASFFEAGRLLLIRMLPTEPSKPRVPAPSSAEKPGTRSTMSRAVFGRWAAKKSGVKTSTPFWVASSSGEVGGRAGQDQGLERPAARQPHGPSRRWSAARRRSPAAWSWSSCHPLQMGDKLPTPDVHLKLQAGKVGYFAVTLHDVHVVKLWVAVDKSVKASLRLAEPGKH